MKYVLGICGSISAYKACDLLRELKRSNHQVKVVLTKGAERFVRPEIFNYLGADQTYIWSDDFTHREDTILHIDLRNWLDRLVIAPASANTMAKLANGQCDDLLTSLFLSCEKNEKIIFPAMNTSMLENSITQDNFKRLLNLDKIFIHPTLDGELACGDVGSGKLPLPEDMREFLDSFNFQKSQRTVLISTGATKAPLDAVRFMTNPSSGKTGIEMARAFLKKGDRVILVAGADTFIPTGLTTLPSLSIIKVKTSREMFNAVSEAFLSCDIYISAAAVSDMEFEYQEQKIKKSESLKLEYKWGVDILQEMLKRRKHQKVISFAAETKLTPEILKEKFLRKPVDLMVANEVSNGIHSPQKGFAQETNRYQFIKDGFVESEKNLSKLQLAEQVVKMMDTKS